MKELKENISAPGPRDVCPYLQKIFVLFIICMVGPPQVNEMPALLHAVMKIYRGKPRKEELRTIRMRRC